MLVAASIRMLALTLFVIAIVYCAPVQLWASEDKFTRLGASGRTSLSLLDHLALPALAKPDTVWAAAIRPAAFGLVDLSDAVFIAPLSFATVSVRGTANSRWIDLQSGLMRAWNLTPNFRVGLSPTVRLTAAPGFASHIEVLTDVHAVIYLDSIWTVSCLVVNALRIGSREESPIRGPRIQTAVARSIGDYVASMELALVSGQDIGLLFEAADVRSPALRWRASFCTFPLALGTGLVLPINASMALVCEISHVEHLGYCSMIGVEFVP